MLTSKLMELIVVGGSEWVMVLLIILSIISVGVMIDRGVFFRRRRQYLDELDKKLTPLINTEDTAGIREHLTKERDPILDAAVSGHDSPTKDREAAEKRVTSAICRQRLVLERRLSFLGTLGNNAPFIGLFGTVLGIIRAFRDLALAGKPDTTVVMAGISEALVATAIGLFVALPAVLFYNFFMKQVDHTLSITESMALGILAGIHPAGSTDEEKRGGQ